MVSISTKHLNRILEVCSKKTVQADNKFDLFAVLDKAGNENDFIYRCGYYIINKYCNKNLDLKIKDTFYTIYLNTLLKFDMMQLGKIEFFEVYKLRDLTDKQISDVLLLTNDIEDVREDLIEKIMDIEHINII